MEAAAFDCDIFERGFARVRCPDCAAKYLLAFSCKGRGICPSCGAKRAAGFAAFLKDEVVADVGHAQWVFTVPKLLRPFFIHHRQLLGPLRAAASRPSPVIACATPSASSVAENQTSYPRPA